MVWKNESRRHSMSARGVKTAVTVMIPRVIEIKKGQKYQTDVDLNINHKATRWDVEGEYPSNLFPKGKYIVDWVDDEHVHLSEADWSPITHDVLFHSDKHGYIIPLKDLVKLIKVGD